METIEIPRSEYDELKAGATKISDLEKRITGLEETAAKVPDLEKQVEQAEIAKKKAEDERDDERKQREGLEEQARAQTLSGERLSKLGEPFTAKLPDSVKTRLSEQAKTMSDEDWAERLEELAAMTGVKPDEKGEGKGDGGGGGSGGTFTREETARANLSGGSGAQEPSRIAVSTVLGGLFEQTRPPQRREPAKR